MKISKQIIIISLHIPFIVIENLQAYIMTGKIPKSHNNNTFKATSQYT
jgi:hypothetical protein